MSAFSLLFLMLLFAGITPFLLMTLAQVVQIKSPGALKYIAYESGMAPFGDAKVQFDIKFYMYALLFIVFDIETVFLFPWAMAYGNLGLFALIEMLLFVGILFLGLLYAWKKDALNWQ